MGGLDWAGLPLVVELLGIADVEHLIDALLAIKLHKGDDESPTAPEPSEDTDEWPSPP